MPGRKYESFEIPKFNETAKKQRKTTQNESHRCDRTAKIENDLKDIVVRGPA